MTNENLLSFADGLLSDVHKISQLSLHLVKFDQFIDWTPLIQAIAVIDKSDAKTGGRPRTNLL